MRVGLTGGIASGKSTVAQLLVELGAVLIDGDALAREVVARGTPGLAAVIAEFGSELLTPELTVETFRVASLPAQHPGGDDLFLAGGAVPDGAPAYAVEYAFPDGTTEDAQVETDAEGHAWWHVEHHSPAYRGNITRQPEIVVTVSLSGVQQQFTLEWGIDTCAQASHGC